MSKISTLEWFLKDHVTLKTGVKLHLNIYINKTFTCNNISQYYCLKIALILLPLNIKINAACVSIRKKLGMHRCEHFGRYDHILDLEANNRYIDR